MNLNPRTWFSNKQTKNQEIKNKPSAEYTRRVYPALYDGNLFTQSYGQTDKTYIQEGYQKNATLYSIINIIIRNAKTIPFKIYQVKQSSAIKNYQALTGSGMNDSSLLQARAIKARSFVEATDTNVEEVLKKSDYHKLLSNYIGYGKLTGNRYLYGIKDSRGRVGEMHILPSQYMEIVSGGFLEQIRGYRLRYNPNKEYEFDADEIAHRADFNPDWNQNGSHLYGQSPLRAAYRSLQANNEGLDTGKEALERRSAQALLFPKEMDSLDEPEALALDTQLTNKMKRTRGGLAITGVPMDWLNLSTSMSDVALIEQMSLTDKQLCNIYGVPIQFLNNTEASTLNNVRELKSFMFQNAIIPELITLREDLNDFLVKPYGEDLYLDFDFTVIPELQMEVEKMVSQLDKSWWMTPNEKRRVMNHAEDENNELMNEYFVPVNLMPMKNMDFQTLESMEQALNESRRVTQSRQNRDGDEDKSFSDSMVTKADTYDDYPKAASNNAQKVLDWIDEYGRDEVQGMTRTGLARANQLAKREAISKETIGRMAAFERHRENSKVSEEYKNTPYKDKGYVAWLGWGGDEGIAWAQRKLDQLESED